VSRAATTEPVAAEQAVDLAPLRVLADAVATPAAGPLRQLPRGGRQIFPRHLVVAHYGTAGTGALGVLGEGTPQQAAARLLQAAAPFAAASGRPVLPAFELIATIAQRSPGPDGMYSSAIPAEEITRYLAAARRAKALLILDLQPGRADFLDQARRLEPFLRQPDVGLALDPEWKLAPGQRPGRQIGSVSVAEVNRVSAWLARVRADNALPEKLFVVHQFRDFMIRDRAALAARPGLATVVHLDGFGTQRVKRSVYDALAVRTGPVHNGLKLFLDEDTDLFTPREAMAFRPRPDLITYQ
jgi:hypothetical protein